MPGNLDQSPRRPSFGRRPEWAAFWLLVAVHLVPLFLFKYFPSQDGPAHLHNAVILRDYFRPEGAAYRQYFTIRTAPDPNLGSHLVLAALMLVFQPLIAEKILLAGYVILLPLSVRYALRGIKREAAGFSILAFPFIYSFPLHMGFYNFCYSIAMFFFVVGYWLRHKDRFGIRNAALLMLFTLILYFCHLLSLAMAAIAIFAMGAWLAALEVVAKARSRGLSGSFLWGSLSRRLLLPAVAFLPSICLAVVFVSAGRATTGMHAPFRVLLQYLVRLGSLVSYSNSESIFSTALAAVFGAVFLAICVLKIARRRFGALDGLLLVVAAYVALYFAAPISVSGGGFIGERLNLFPFLFIILWFGAQTCPVLLKRAVQTAVPAIALILLGIHSIKYYELNDYLQEYLSGSELVTSGATVLPLSFSHQGRSPEGRLISTRVEPFLHAAGYIAAERGAIDLDNYEATTGYFPVAFRPEVNPFKHMAVGPGLEGQPPGVDIAGYEGRTGGRVDYVLVWGLQEWQVGLEETKSIFRQLGDGYELVYASPQRGMMHLYRRKPAATP